MLSHVLTSLPVLRNKAYATMSHVKAIIWDYLCQYIIQVSNYLGFDNYLQLILMKLYIGIGIGNFVANISAIGISVNFHISAPL